MAHPMFGDGYSAWQQNELERRAYEQQMMRKQYETAYFPQGFGSGQPGQQAVEKPQPKQNKKLLLLTT